MADEDIDLTERTLRDFIAACQETVAIVKARTSVPVRNTDVQQALEDVLDCDWMHLLDRDWTTGKIVDALRGYDFGRLHPELLDRVQLEQSILPDGIVRRVVEKNFGGMEKLAALGLYCQPES